MKGRILSHFEILEKLGEGGMGTVWQARDTRLNRLVAIKMLPAHMVHDEQRKQRFVQEAQAASALNHPNIITIYDIASEGGGDFIVMELVKGKTLDQTISRRGMRLNEMLSCGIQIADALATAHEAGIVHRDLKPGNVMVTAEGRVKVLDFGLAKLTEPARVSEDDQTQTMKVQTEDGTIVGTVAYMSPEQAEGKKVDGRSDIFSFGAMLYEMTTGVAAFRGGSKVSILSAILKSNPKPPSEIDPGVPRDLEKIILRCLRKDAVRRYQTMTDLKLALEDLKEESESDTRQAAVIPQKRRSSVLIAAIGAGLAVALAAAWYFLQSQPKSLTSMVSRPLTAYAGNELNPSFSPDGNQVAFVWNGEKQDNYNVWVKLVDGGAPLRLTTDPAYKCCPQWSPDGRTIAFIRNRGVYLISPLGGVERKLADTKGQIGNVAWMPDGKSLLVTTSENEKGPSVFQLSSGDGEMRKLTTMPGPGIGDGGVAASPDGRSFAFVRYQNGADLYVSPMAGGEPRRLTNDRRNILGLVWAGNKEIIFSSDRLGVRTLWRINVDGRSEPQPIPGVQTDASNPTIVYPAKSAPRLAYERTTYDSNIWRMDAPDPGARAKRDWGPAVEVIASTRIDMGPQFSPDGKKIAFVSDRSGNMEIWVSGSGGENPVQLSMMGGAYCGSPRWSPDGRRIVFDSFAGGNNDLWLIGAEGGQAKRVTFEPSDDGRASWSIDGKWIYFRSDRSGTRQIWKIPSEPPYKPAVAVTRSGGAQEAFESADGKVLYFVKSTGGLWSLPVEGGDEKMVIEAVRQAYWGVAGNGIYFLDFTRQRRLPTPVQFFSFASNNLSRIGEIGKEVDRSRSGFSVTRDGRAIAWSQFDRRETDLMLIDNFR
jgi:serine/threonine protein kinase